MFELRAIPLKSFLLQINLRQRQNLTRFPSIYIGLQTSQIFGGRTDNDRPVDRWNNIGGEYVTCRSLSISIAAAPCEACTLCTYQKDCLDRDSVIPRYLLLIERYAMLTRSSKTIGHDDENIVVSMIQKFVKFRKYLKDLCNSCTISRVTNTCFGKVRLVVISCYVFTRLRVRSITDYYW